MTTKAVDHSHSIVNSRVPLRGKTGLAPTEDRLDTDKSTVVFNSAAGDSLDAILGVNGSQQGYENEIGMS